jgi:hypothetical protein
MDEEIIREMVKAQARMEAKLDAHSISSAEGFKDLKSEVRAKHRNHEERIWKTERRLNIMTGALALLTTGGAGLMTWLKGG